MSERAEPRKIKFTERAVERLKLPKSGRIDYWDQTLPAFGIQLRATGRRRWIIAVRRPGKSTTSRIVIGYAKTMPLAEARDRARQLMQDPGELEAPAEETDPGRLTVDSTINAVIAGFILRDQKPRNRSWRCSEQILRHDLWRWYTRPLGSITDRDVLDLLDQVLDRGKPRAANLLLAHIKRMFNWCTERRLISASPAAGIKPPSPKSERDRVLADPELHEIWHGCDRLGWPFGPLVQLLMLTAQREGEVASMRWSDLDLEAATWSLTSSQTKAGRAHLIPLSAEAVRILKALPRFEHCDLVFPANRTGNARPVSGFSKVKRRLDLLCGATIIKQIDGENKLVDTWENWVFHDLRRTAATAMAQLQVPPHVTEKILNHRAANVAGPMGKVYQRYDYLDERREALELWAQTLARITKTGRRCEVVPLRAG
jgi:integrase